MDERVQQALQQDRVIDITTIGRKSGRPRRKEIWFHNLDGRLYITGRPGPRDWYSNMLANPEFTFHLKQSAQADLRAKATPLLDPDQRREVLSGIHEKLGGDRDTDAWVQGSPLVEVELLG